MTNSYRTQRRRPGTSRHSCQSALNVQANTPAAHPRQLQLQRPPRPSQQPHLSWRRLPVLLCAALLLLANIAPAYAQAPTIPSFRIYPRLLQHADGLQSLAPAEAQTAETTDPKKIIIDTDPGVDDAAALAWALVQDRYPVDILGIVATAGNTTSENATNNALLIRNLAGAIDIPVYIGEKKALNHQISGTGLLIHGQDGLWGAATPQDLNQAAKQAWKFYCDMARSQPGATIIALGPLTNVGRAIRSCGADMRNYAEIIVLGGAQFGGNTTPVAEFNIWQDPEAAELVFTSGIKITLVPLDTFTQLQFDPFIHLSPLATSENPLAQLLACPLGDCTLESEDVIAMGCLFPHEQFGGLPLEFCSPLGYYLATQFFAVGEASIPDIAAIMYALDPSLGSTARALLKVVTKPELVRGQTVIGSGDAAKVTMIADDREMSLLAESAFVDGSPFSNFFLLQAAIDAILAREPDNVAIVTAIDVEEMRTIFLDDLTSTTLATAAEIENSPDTLGPGDAQIFVPLLTTAGD